jgi:hypothetical protein
MSRKGKKKEPTERETKGQQIRRRSKRMFGKQKGNVKIFSHSPIVN